MPDWFARDLTLLIRGMLRAYHRTLPDRRFAITVSATAGKVPRNVMEQFWGRTVTLRATGADVDVMVGDASSIETAAGANVGALILAGTKGEDYYVRRSEEWGVVGSTDGVLYVLWSSQDGLPVTADDYGT